MLYVFDCKMSFFTCIYHGMSFSKLLNKTILPIYHVFRFPIPHKFLGVVDMATKRYCWSNNNCRDIEDCIHIWNPVNRHIRQKCDYESLSTWQNKTEESTKLWTEDRDLFQFLAPSSPLWELARGRLLTRSTQELKWKISDSAQSIDVKNSHSQMLSMSKVSQ